MGDSRRNFDELLGDALDGRLTPSDRERFRVLLAQSEEDSRTFDSLKDLREKLLIVGTDGAPAGLAASIAKRIREGHLTPGPSDANGDPSGSRPVGWWSHFPAMGWVRVAAVIVVLALVATILVEERRKDASPKDGGREGARVVADDDENATKHRQADAKAEGGLGEPPARKAERAPRAALESEAPGAPKQGADGREASSAARRDSAGTLSGPEAERGDPPSLATRLDRLGKVLGVRTDADPHSFERSSGGVDVVDELAFHLTRNLRDFSREELKSPGILAWAEDQDQRFKDRGVFAGASPGPAAPRGRGRTPGPPDKGAGPGHPPSETKGPPPGGLAPASVVPPVSREARFFYSLSGAGARDGVLRTLQAFGPAKELPVREAFGGAAKKGHEPQGETTQAEGYAIFEIELPKERADAVVAALEGLENTTLRTLGRSLLESNGVPAAPRPGGEAPAEMTPSLEDLERKKGESARRAPPPELRTLVIMVLERWVEARRGELHGNPGR
jgi:hypothetical protein